MAATTMALSLEASFERCCRLCAEEQEVSIMIFSEEAEAMLLQNRLNKYLLIEVDEDDKLPKNICITCCTKLQTVCDFIDTARNAQEMLLNRSIMLEHMDHCIADRMPDHMPDNMPSHMPDCVPDHMSDIHMEIKSEQLSDDEAKITEMEISVDPMMVLQNSEEPLSPVDDPVNNLELNSGDVTHLHGIDGENVTIKLIRKETPEVVEDKKDFNLKPFPCLACKRSFFTELALKNHSWIHIGEDNLKQYKCTSCVESFDYKCDLLTHIKEHRSTGVCKICGRTNEKNLTIHMAVHQSTCKSHTCKVCGRSYNTRSNLKTHSITHSNVRPYKCHLCNKGFKRNQDLKFHINQHTGDKPYKCPFCEKCFASSGNCYSHRSRMHPGRRVESKRRRAAVSRENQGVLRVIAPKTGQAGGKGVFKYQCQLCEHSFLKRDNFTYHMYQHTGQKPFHCSFCPDKFVTRKGLLLHHDKQHSTKDRPLALLSKNALLK